MEEGDYEDRNPYTTKMRFGPGLGGGSEQYSPNPLTGFEGPLRGGGREGKGERGK